jgi:small subunit ribosomal protein S21
MLRITVNEGETIERALKRYRKKTKQTKLIATIRENRYYTKKSIKRKREIEKAEYKEYLKLLDE